MPLIEARATAATVGCLGCEGERVLHKADWVIVDDETFGTPPCPTCGAQEFFAHNDEVYISRRDLPNGRTMLYADPEHPGAEQQVLVARVAQGLQRKQRRVERHGFRANLNYPQQPKAPAPDKVRGYVRGLAQRQKAGRTS